MVELRVDREQISPVYTILNHIWRVQLVVLRRVVLHDARSRDAGMLPDKFQGGYVTVYLCGIKSWDAENIPDGGHLIGLVGFETETNDAIESTTFQSLYSNLLIRSGEGGSGCDVFTAKEQKRKV